MIRHFVMFQFKEEAQGRTKEENVAITKKMLDALPGKIAWIRNSYTAVAAKGASPANYDLILVTDFDSLEDLERYRVHPDHVAVGDFMRPVRISRTCIDIEI